MKRKLIAALMAMTLTLSCGVTALAEEPPEDGTEISQVGNGEDEDEGKVEKEGIVPNDLVNPSKDGTVVTEDSLKEIEENVTEKPNPAADGEDTAEQELPIDEAHFPDVNFRKYIIEIIDKDGNGSLSQDEIKAVTAINTNDGNTYTDIKNFKGIEYFSNMGFLVLGNMSIESLDVSKNTKLEEINIRNCQITNLVLNSDLDGLGYFDGSQISNVDAKNLKLKKLWCDGNLISS